MFESRIYAAPADEPGSGGHDLAAAAAQVPPSELDTSVPVGGGGGGTPGATMDTRVADVLPGMGPEAAADTGGVAIDPTRILPTEGAGLLGAEETQGLGEDEGRQGPPL